MRDIKGLYEQWKKSANEDSDISEELRSLTNEGEISDRFFRELEFGTGGLRGVLGAGTNRMNIYTVRKATQGLAEYILSADCAKSAAIAYDSRNKSKLFAQEAAGVLAANGIRTYIYPKLMPTPTLSFAVRKLGCGAGICITASHNPAKYNGYKVYGADGCQITSNAASEISGRILAIDPFSGVKTSDYTKQFGKNLEYIPARIKSEYLSAVLGERVGSEGDRGIKIVYTPLNGSGLDCVTEALSMAGYNSVRVVAEQAEPNGNFPTCPFPNPEIEAAMRCGLKLGEETKADLVLATDPDCDRVGIAAKGEDRLQLMTGNEVGVLLLDYICTVRKESGTLPKNPVAVKTIVTTEMAQKIADYHGVKLINVLTGFKFIGEQIGQLEASGEAERYILGFEESYGYLSGTYVRDKDAVNASLLICDMAAWYKAKNLTLFEAMENLYARFGYCKNTLNSFTFEGEEGLAAMESFMSGLRKNPPGEIGGEAVAETRDYLWSDGTGEHTLPSSNVLQFVTGNKNIITVRPSGTEPTLKVYYSVSASDKKSAEIIIEKMKNEIGSLVSCKS